MSRVLAMRDALVQRQQELLALHNVASIDDLPTDLCTCVYSCGSCSLSGDWHVHPDADGRGLFGPCPLHPDAPGDW